MSTLDGNSHRAAGRPYLRYTPDVEVQQPDEAALTAEILDVMARSNHVAFERHRHAVRDAHAKSHGILTGERSVHRRSLSSTSSPEKPDEGGCILLHSTYNMFSRILTYRSLLVCSSIK